MLEAARELASACLRLSRTWQVCVIVHERGTNKHNRIVIEVKVKGRGASSEVECNRDREKLRRLRFAFDYVDAFFVLLDLREKHALIESID